MLVMTKHGRLCKCGDIARHFHDQYGWRCFDCIDELVNHSIPHYRDVTSKKFHIPEGMNLIRLNRVPGVQEPYEYFGSTTEE